MNAILDVIEHRKSVRAYEPRPIGREQRNAIIHAALRAPTAGNQMLYTILEIEDQAIKDRLAVTCDHQPFIAKAPLVLVFLADYQRWFDFFQASGVEDLCRRTERPFRRPQPGDLMLAISDALVAAQTAVVAAESMGIGSCYIGDVMENYEIHRDLLKLPEFAFPIAMLCFGYPTEQQLQRAKPTRYPRGPDRLQERLPAAGARRAGRHGSAPARGPARRGRQHGAAHVPPEIRLGFHAGDEPLRPGSPETLGTLTPEVKTRSLG